MALPHSDGMLPDLYANENISEIVGVSRSSPAFSISFYFYIISVPGAFSDFENFIACCTLSMVIILSLIS